MTKEDYSSLLLIGLSALAIIVINLSFFIKMGKKAYKKVFEFYERFQEYKDEAWQWYETIKLKVLFCYDFSRACFCGTKQDKKDKADQIRAMIRAYLGEYLPLDKMQELRENYCCNAC